jgi:hypothetical protein
VSGQLHGPAALPPEKSPRYPLCRKLCGPQSRCGRRGENTWPYRDSNPDLSVVQPVAVAIPTALSRLTLFSVRKGIFLSATTSRLALRSIQRSMQSVLGAFQGAKDSAIGIVTGYEPDDRGVAVWVPVWSRIFYSPYCPYRLWGLHSLLSNGYCGYFLDGKAAWAWS